MGKLFDAFKNKNKDNTVIDKTDESQHKEIRLGKYSRSWASKIALHQGYELNDDMKKVDGILDALYRRDGQCPCGGSGAQYKCPCNIMRTKGICKCGLFKTIEDRKIKSVSSNAKIKVSDE